MDFYKTPLASSVFLYNFQISVLISHLRSRCVIKHNLVTTVCLFHLGPVSDQKRELLPSGFNSVQWL